MSLQDRLNQGSNHFIASLLGQNPGDFPTPIKPSLGIPEDEFVSDLKILHSQGVKQKEVETLLGDIQGLNIPVAKKKVSELWPKFDIQKKITTANEGQPTPKFNIIKPKSEAKIGVAMPIKDRDVSVTQRDIDEAKKVLFAEVSNREPEKQKLETEVILNTAINRMKEYAAAGNPKSLTEVLKEENQYQGYGSKQYKLYESGQFDEPTKKKKEYIDSLVEDFLTKGIKDNTNNAFFYTHDEKTGKITYDDLKPLLASRPKKK